jgi:hypothetical protein
MADGRIPGGGVGGGFSSGAASGASGGGGANWENVAKAIMQLVPFVGAMFGGGNNAQNQALQMPPEMRNILNVQNARMRFADPLYGDVVRMARGMLPTRYRGPGVLGQPTPIPDGAPGTDDRQPTPNAVTTGRHAIPRIPEY